MMAAFTPLPEGITPDADSSLEGTEVPAASGRPGNRHGLSPGTAPAERRAVVPRRGIANPAPDAGLGRRGWPVADRPAAAPDVLDPVGLAGPGRDVGRGGPRAAPAPDEALPAADGRLQLRHLDRHGRADYLGRGAAPPGEAGHRARPPIMCTAAKEPSNLCSRQAPRSIFVARCRRYPGPSRTARDARNRRSNGDVKAGRTMALRRHTLLSTLLATAVLLALLTPASIAAAADSPPAATTPQCWATAHHEDALHNGLSCTTLPADPVNKWSVTLNGDASYPVIAGGKVFVATSAPGGSYGGSLYALSASTGKVVWARSRSAGRTTGLPWLTVTATSMS